MRPIRTLLPLLVTLTLPAQQIRIPAVSFTGAPAYAQADLLQLSGLQPGAVGTPQTIQTAAQHLNDTGLFTAVHYESHAGGIVFTLTPMPASSVLPVSYTNFVWWQTAELNALVKARVPLFLGSVPNSGNLQDAVAATLTDLVKAKGVPAVQVSGILHAGTSLTPDTFAYTIDAPSITIGTLTVDHATPAFQPRLDAIAQHQVGKPWEGAESRTGITSSITSLYRDNGYLDIDVTSLTNTPPTLTPTGVSINLTATVSEGEPYRISSITWAGSDVLSTADFDKSLRLHPEDIASQALLRESLRPLANALAAHGYQDAKVRAPSTINRSTHHVSYTVTAIPGEVYRFHTVQTAGLSPDQQTAFNSIWHLHPGDPYDAIYVSSFLAHAATPRSLQGYVATYKDSADPGTHLVDLTITFTRPSTAH